MGKFAKKHMFVASRWHFFNLGDTLTKKPVTPQDDKDCYKSLVSKKYLIMPPLSPDLGPGHSQNLVPDIAILGPNQGSSPFAFSPAAQYFRGGVTRDRRIWNGRDPPSSIRKPTNVYVYTILYVYNTIRHHVTLYMGPTPPWGALFPRNHKAISFCSNLTRRSTGVSQPTTAAIYSLLRNFDF